jgi:uncharacterized protein
MRFITIMMAGLSLLLCSSIASAQDKAALSDYDKGVTAFDNGQFEEARVLYTKACDGGIAEGCYNLGVMHAKGRGGAVDDAQARVLYAKACNGGIAAGCYNSGVVHYLGKGGAKDISQAKIYMRKSCDLGDKEACEVLAKIRL